MALTTAFHEAVKSGNVRNVRIMMKNSMLIDPTFEEFHAMEKASASMAGLYDDHDHKEFRKDRSSWDDDYMNKEMVNVLFNFSHERIEHLKEVVRYLRPVAQQTTPKSEERAPKRKPDSSRSSYEEEKRRCQERGDLICTEVGIGAFAGAAVGAGIALVAGAGAVGVAGGVAAGAVVGGVSTALIVNKDK